VSFRMILLILSQPVQLDVGFSSHVSLPLLAGLDLDSNCVNSHWVLVNKAKNKTYGMRSFFITKTCFLAALPNPIAQQVYKNNLNLKHLSFFNLCLCPLVVSTSTSNRMLLTLYRSRVCIPSHVWPYRLRGLRLVFWILVHSAFLIWSIIHWDSLCPCYY